MQRIFIVLAVTTASFATTVHADESFQRKAGHWNVTMNNGDKQAPMLAEFCLAADTDARIQKATEGMMAGLCPKSTSHKEGNTYVTDSECRVGKQLTATHKVITVDGDHGYHMVITSHPVGKAGTESTSEMTGRWTGACPAGMEPGDELLHTSPTGPAGSKINVLKQLEGK